MPAIMRRDLVIRLLGSLCVVAVCGCATVTRHGDAKLYEQKNFILKLVDPLIFPQMPIGHVANYRYKVTSLPQTIYPSGFYLEVPNGEDDRWEHNQPWRACRIRASLSKTDGERFFTRTIDFSKDWNGNSAPGRNGKYRRIFLFFTDYDLRGTTKLPKHLSYNVEIEVLRPSLRTSDKLWIDAVTLMPDARD